MTNKTRMSPSTSNSLVATIALFYLISDVSGQAPFISRVCQDTFGNYTTNSKFKTNLDKLLVSITSNTQIDYGFYNFSVGYGFDRVNGIGLCMPDLSVSDCQSCLQDGAKRIVQECPAQKDAIGWYEKCMIRYSDRYIFGKLEFGPWYHEAAYIINTDKESFNQTASTLLARLQKVASGFNDSRYKFGFGEATIDNSRTLYALVQCTPDLEAYDCYQCLDNAIDFSLSNNFGYVARLFYTSCNIRYEAVAFYNLTSLASLELELQHSSSPPPLAPLSPPSTINTQGKRTKKSRIVIFLPVLLASLVLLSILFIYYRFRRARRTKPLKNVEIGHEIRTPESLQMDFATIKDATSNFSDGNRLGRGGFGTVYKGKLPNGQEIAVKRLSQNVGQGEEEFKNEALLVARLQHRNLVRFLGFCLQEEERLLIYELLPNKSLDYFLFDPVKRVHLDWQTRHKIIEGIARGLRYLHEDSRLLVVHRDLKAGNILLDAEMNSKIADFGMAKLFGADETHGQASRICGTYGYMSPEYVQCGKFSIKSDVFSFGVLLLEIITGLRISSFYDTATGDNLLSLAWRNWLEGTTMNIVDSAMSKVNNAQILRCINIGLLCVQEDMSHRPIMSSVVLLLNSNTVSIPVPSRPGFLLNHSLCSDSSNNGQSDRVVHYSANYDSISDVDPR